MPAETVRVHGDKRLAATLVKAARDLGHMDTANRRVAMAIAQKSRGPAPKRTGRLARSTTGTAAPNNTARMSASVVYAGVIHNGWARHGISPNPWLAHTVESTQAQWVNSYGTEVQKIVDNVKGA